MKDKSIKIVAIVVITVSFLAIGFSSGVIIGSLIGRAPEKVSAPPGPAPPERAQKRTQS